MFFTGLFLGVALAATIGGGYAFSTLVSGRGLGGSTAVVAAQPTVQPTAQPSAPVAAGPVKPVDDKVDHVRGPANAKVTLIEYSDFQCPFCDRHEPTMTQVLQQYPNDVRLIYRHYPLTQLHPQAEKAAEASECAAKLGGNDAFWKAHDYLFANQATLGTDLYKKMAGELKLDVAKFTTCLDSGEMSGRVAQDTASGNDAGVSGTPATFVNGQLVEGAVPFEQFKSAIDAAL